MIRANELRHKSLTSAHVILLHGADVNISIKLDAEVNIRCRSPQLGAEVTAVPKLLVPNIDFDWFHSTWDILNEHKL